MTQNDISFYNARNEKIDAKRRRQETKRHNKIMEAIGAAELTTKQQQAQASLTSASAAATNAAANAQNAATREHEYQLEWEREYGWSYGTPQEIMTNDNNYVIYDVVTGDTYSSPRSVPKGDTYVSVPDGQVVPNSYMTSLIKIGQSPYQTQYTKEDVTNKRISSILGGVKTGEVISDTLYRDLRRLGVVD